MSGRANCVPISDSHNQREKHQMRESKPVLPLPHPGSKRPSPDQGAEETQSENCGRGERRGKPNDAKTLRKEPRVSEWMTHHYAARVRRSPRPRLLNPVSLRTRLPPAARP